MDQELPPAPVIFEDFVASTVEASQMDALWAQGWRHFGPQFFRNSLHLESGRWLMVLPLRIRLSAFRLSKSQRRVLRKNEDLTCTFQPIVITEELNGMFDRHRQRFVENVPNDLTDFLGKEPENSPCEGTMLLCHLGDRLVAASFLDLGERAVSSIYGIFEPEHDVRSLGIFTMLKEIEFAQGRGTELYYPGYATSGPSHYDYKKQFSALEGYEWIPAEWAPLRAERSRRRLSS